jgi:tRNA(fMet)-specific endonuclease VapC
MTLTHLVDTDVCIKVLKKKDRALVQRVGKQVLSIGLSDISVFELYAGAERYADRRHRISVIESFLSQVTVVPFDTTTARHAGNIRYELEHAGKLIGAYDILIAATARAKGLVLATGNVREFSRVEGLRVEKWG